MGMDLAEVVFDATSDLECGLTARPEGTNDCSRKTLVSQNSLKQLPVDVRYATRVEALRAAVDLILSKRGSDNSVSQEPEPTTA